MAALLNQWLYKHTGTSLMPQGYSYSFSLFLCLMQSLIKSMFVLGVAINVLISLFLILKELLELNRMHVFNSNRLDLPRSAMSIETKVIIFKFR